LLLKNARVFTLLLAQKHGRRRRAEHRFDFSGLYAALGI
jgi:hypothetical protein